MDFFKNFKDLKITLLQFKFRIIYFEFWMTTRGQETSQINTTPLKSDPQALSSNSNNMPSNAAPFFVNQQLEAIDENETPKKWYKANVVQVDLAEQKILVHFKVILGWKNIIFFEKSSISKKLE